MQIKPKVIDFDQEKGLKNALQGSNVRKSRKDFYIYDEYLSRNTSFALENRICAGVVQVNRYLIKGMPKEEGFYYDRPEEGRMTFVKVLYFYNAFMNENIGNIPERFSKAALRPIIAVIGAYTDTKQQVITGLNGEIEYINNQFGLTIYNFESKNILSMLCSPIMVRDGIIAKVSRLDIPDPRYNSIHYLNEESKSNCLLIPSHFVGKDLVKNRDENIHSYKSYYKDNNSFTEESLLNESQRIFSTSGQGFSSGNTGLVPAHLINEKITSDIRDKKRTLSSLITDITKASAYSLFESFTMMYETGKRPSFKIIKPPFKQYHIDYMDEKMNYVYIEFTKLCEHVVELFGAIRLLLYVNDVEHVVRCTFLSQKSSKYNRVVTLRMTKLECINDYISETLYGDQFNKINRFKEDHDFDLLNYYAYQKGGSQYIFEGAF
jgi:hypothetical protein